MANPEEDKLRIPASHIGDENERLLRSRYLKEVNVFRTAVNVLLRKYPIDEANKWLYYSLRDQRDIDSEAVIDRDMVIMVHTAESQPGAAEHQLIRIIESETYKVPYGLEFFTTDVTIDHKGDALYAVDSVRLVEGEGVKPSSVPFFMYDGTNLSVTKDMNPITRMLKIDYEVNGADTTVAPFGHYKNIYDQQHALAVANRLLNTALKAEPVATSAGRLQ